eukprot:TRINITY_DN10490_c0_g1_i2.p1 TRINITY_DN10490_c0_g1~~TRINITY_DN10490_c0_g1_i2.p1  ORF type:complete len:1124 (+),score=253.03 TRINITY_DN10490_c0_g1_i2:76-3447(+)
MTQSLYLNPTFSSVCIINVYPTYNFLFVIGCDESQSKFRVLKIDRNSIDGLNIIDDGVEYSKEEIQDLVIRIEAIGGPKSQVVTRKKSGFGIFGFVRFTNGYHMILITKRRKVAMIGTHIVYRVEDTMMISVANSAARGNVSADEGRYIKIFHNVDLTSNFYFSYTYDLTRPLQSNMYIPTPEEVRGDHAPVPVAIQPNSSFLWNHYLLQPAKDVVHARWNLTIIYGFVAQSELALYNKRVLVTLIARRSRHFAGTRFLKRGCDVRGNCANHVESEQIVHDAAQASHRNIAITSFVQMRGSVPVFWQQDNSGMRAKPPISMAKADPYYSSAALHFEKMLQKFGPPLVIFDLVKRKEKKPRESILLQGMTSAIDYLNRFIEDADERILHDAWDMARQNKSKEPVVLKKLDEYANGYLKRLGIFAAQKRSYLLGQEDEEDTPLREHAGRNQSGIVRVNCVDCLDRTNTAQFMIGLCALRHQLYELGILEDTDAGRIHPDSPANRALEELYEDHGDTIALQYGGSQLVNRIQTYRKIRPWTSNSRDILNTVTRYYSNSFTDADKQMAINLFLGKYQPLVHTERLWDMDNDYLLHHSHMISDHDYPRPHYIHWHNQVRHPILERFRQGTSEPLLVPRRNITADCKLFQEPNTSASDRQLDPLNVFGKVRRRKSEMTSQALAVPSAAAAASGDSDLFSSPPSSIPSSLPTPEATSGAVTPAGPRSPRASSPLRDGEVTPQASAQATPESSPKQTVAEAKAGKEKEVNRLRNIYLNLRRHVCKFLQKPTDRSLKDLFDDRVQTLLHSWGIKQPDGEAYVQAARWIAARFGLVDGSVPTPFPSVQLRLSETYELHYACWQLTEFDGLYELTMPSTNRVVQGMQRLGNPFHVPIPLPPEANPWDHKSLAHNPNQTRVAGQAPVADDSDDDLEDSSDEEVDATLSASKSPIESSDDHLSQPRRQSFTNDMISTVKNDDVAVFHRYVSVDALSRQLAKPRQLKGHRPRSRQVRMRSQSHTITRRDTGLHRSGSMQSGTKRPEQRRLTRQETTPEPNSSTKVDHRQGPMAAKPSGEVFNLVKLLGPLGEIPSGDHMLYSSVITASDCGTAQWRPPDDRTYASYLQTVQAVATSF